MGNETLQESKRDGPKRADKDERPEWQGASAGCPVQGQQHPAVDGGQGERGKGTGEQRLPAGPAERGADAGSELGVTQAHAARSDDRQGQVETGEGGSADGRAADVARLVAGERGDGQEGEGADAGCGGERVRESVNGRVDEAEGDGEQGQPGQCR